MSDLKSQGIETYAFPTDDETASEINSKLNVIIILIIPRFIDHINIYCRL